MKKVFPLSGGRWEEVLGASLHRGKLPPDEHRMLANIDKRFTDPNWLYEKGGKLNNWIKPANWRVNLLPKQRPGGVRFFTHR